MIAKYTLSALTVLFASAVQAHECKIDTSLPLESYGITAVSTSHHAIHTEIIINAAPDKVWSTLISPDNQWSSSYRGITGELGDENKVTVGWKMKNGKETTFPLILKNYVAGQQFGWSEEFPNAKGIFDNHLYKVEKLSECQTRFIQTDAFSGTSTQNPDASTATFAENVLPGYVKFNRELKAETEKR